MLVIVYINTIVNSNCEPVGVLGVRLAARQLRHHDEQVGDVELCLLLLLVLLQPRHPQHLPVALLLPLYTRRAAHLAVSPAAVRTPVLLCRLFSLAWRLADPPSPPSDRTRRTPASSPPPHAATLAAHSFSTQQ